MPRLIKCISFVLVLLFTASALAQDLRIERERMIGMLKLASSDIEKNFYDPTLKGLDWKGLTAAAEERIKKANTAGEMMTAIFSLVDKLQDSHTRFWPPDRVNRPLFGFEAKAFGDNIYIYQIKAKSAAANAGMQIGDRILNVNGFNAERNSFDLMMLYFHRLRPASTLKITYQRGNDAPKTIVVQAKIKRDTAVFDATDEENIERRLYYEVDSNRVDYYSGFSDSIGYVEVSDFDTEEIGIVHKLDKPAAVVIDLRENGGGSVKTLLELAGHFEPEATTMGDIVSRKKTEPLKIKPQRPNVTVPMVILVDSRSASAAEMFARYFQRNGRAVVVGDNSLGRVNASKFFSEQIGTDRLVGFTVQIATGKVVLPGGEELEHHGITPDVPCVPTAEDLHGNADPCLVKAVSVAREKAKLPPLSEKSLSEVNGFARQIAEDRQQRLDQRPD